MAADSPDVIDTVQAAYRQHFELAPARASVSFVGLEPIEVLRFPDGDFDHYVTLGMSRHPMADPSEVVVDAAGAPRAELLITASGRPDELWRSLAVLAAAPAVEAAVYAIGNRIDLTQPLCAGSRCTGGILAESGLEPIPAPGIADVLVFRLLPATQTELAWARVHGSEALRDLWADQASDLSDLFRDPVRLD